MSESIIWRHCAIRYLWYCKKTFSLQERSTIISVGEMNMPVRKRFRESQTCTGRWIRKRISGRLSYDDRTGRKQCFRRTEAASVYCTGTSKKPKILILDDSTSAVDTKTDALIRKAFRKRFRILQRSSLRSEFLL